jgi:ribonuclease HI
MSDSPSIQVWTVSAYLSAYKCGGWAYVRQVGAALSGAAGGERYVTAERMELAGLAAALSGLPKTDAPLVIHTSSARLVASAGLIAGAAPEGDPPYEDLDLWAKIVTAAKGRKVRVVRAAPEPRTPLAFAAAWAELGRDKAKASGAFTSAIPKPNLAKVQGLGR